MRIATITIAAACALLAVAAVYLARMPEPAAERAQSELTSVAADARPSPLMDDDIARAIARAYDRPVSSEEAQQLAAASLEDEQPLESSNQPALKGDAPPEEPAADQAGPPVAAAPVPSEADAQEPAYVDDVPAETVEEREPAAADDVTQEEERIAALEEKVDRILEQRELALRRQRQRDLAALIVMDQLRRELAFRVALGAAVGARDR